MSHRHDGGCGCQPGLQPVPTLKACVAGVPLFRGLQPEHLLAIQETARERRFRRGEILQPAGEIPEHLYILQSGLVKVSSVSPEGKEQILRLLHPGEVLGELALFRSGPSETSATALEDGSACQLDRKDLESAVRRFPDLALSLLAVLSERLEHAERVAAGLGLMDVDRRLARLILDLAGRAGAARSGEPAMVPLPVSKQQLALVLGTSQETLSRKLSLFQERGWIRLQGRRGIVVQDRSALAELAGDSP